MIRSSDDRHQRLEFLPSRQVPNLPPRVEAGPEDVCQANCFGETAAQPQRAQQGRSSQGPPEWIVGSESRAKSTINELIPYASEQGIYLGLAGN